MSTALDDPTTVRRNPHRRALPTRNTQLLAGPSLAPHGKDRRATTGAVALTDRVAVARAQWRNAVVDSRPSRFSVELSAFVGFRFPPEVIALAVRSYLRFELSYRDLERLLAERSVDVDHVTLFRWVRRVTPLLFDASRPYRHGTVALLDRGIDDTMRT